MLKINQIGYNFCENRQSIIDRPKGSGDYLLLYFLTEADILIDNKMQTAQPFSVLIFTPSCAQLYMNQRSGFVNDWIHFNGPEVPELLHMLALPLNRPFLCEPSHEIRAGIQEIEKEFRLKDRFFQYEISARLTRLLIKIARWRNNQDQNSFSPHMTNMYKHMCQVRSVFLTRYSNNWQLEDMARLANLSRSRFCFLYQEFFQTSPMQDLATERFAMARHLLQTTSSNVQEIALRVGYTDLCHFSKQFKKIYGISPGRARTKSGED